ncbi:MAG: HAD hydrolase-like protein [bacterium]|nr:HAD hydrolase-like protein [bacterium]
MVVIGDTPNDILCGQDLGVKAIGVATGRYSREKLSAVEPDFLFEDFSNTEQVIAAILG